MKNLFVLMVILLTSCSTSIYKIKTECEKTNDEIIRELSKLLLQEDFSITKSDLSMGYIEGESLPTKLAFVGLCTKQWSFAINNGVITAYAKLLIINEYGTVTDTKYYYDNAPVEWSWYWNIRNGLQNICGHNVIFIIN